MFGLEVRKAVMVTTNQELKVFDPSVSVTVEDLNYTSSTFYYFSLPEIFQMLNDDTFLVHGRARGRQMDLF